VLTQLRHIRRIWFSVVVYGLLAVHGTVAAQQMYVDDKLVLNVHSEANQGGEKVATIETGDQVELLERVESFARVRLSDGREGWVGANYLTSNAPAVIRLKELESAAPGELPGPSPEEEAARKKLTEEVARLKKQNSELVEETSKLKKAATAAAAAAAATPAPVPAAVSAAPEPDPEPVEPLASPRDPLRWMWPAITAVLLAGLAFWLGYETLARRIRRKYGRVNII
jgi:Bacterial SH3 domain